MGSGGTFIRICVFAFAISWSCERASSLTLTNYDNATSPTDYDESSTREKRQVKNSEIAAVGLAIAMLCASDNNREEKKSCTINIKELGTNHALIIDPQDHTKFLYPDNSGQIHFEENQAVFLSCGMNQNTLTNVPGVTAQTFTCVCGQVFKDNLKKYNFKSLYCDKTPEYKIQDIGVRDYHQFDIGFYTDSQNSFLKLLEVHFREEYETTYYVKSRISKSIRGGQDTSVVVKESPLYCCQHRRTTLDKAFYEISQDKSFKTLYKSEETDDANQRYLRPRTEFVFVRNYLSPKQYMVYRVAALATFARLNVSPQWKNVNKHNWAAIDNHIVEIAGTLEKDLIVFSGAFMHLDLEDKTDNQEKLTFLHAYKKGDQLKTNFPIPLFHFKLVSEPESRKGVVYVTINNPHAKHLRQIEFCANPITSMHGVKMPANWDPKNPQKGYSYMCTVKDFLKNHNLVINDPDLYIGNDLLYIRDDSATTTTSTSTTTTTTTTTIRTTSTTKFVRFYDELR